MTSSGAKFWVKKGHFQFDGSVPFGLRDAANFRVFWLLSWPPRSRTLHLIYISPVVNGVPLQTLRIYLCFDSFCKPLFFEKLAFSLFSYPLFLDGDSDWR